MVEPKPPVNYPPSSYFNQNLPELIEIIDSTKFSTIFVGLETDAIFAPLFIKESLKASLLDGSVKEVELFGHLSRYNPLKPLLDKGPLHCKVVFNCMDMYVTPSIYQKKKKTGDVVPTWDYVSAQLSGVMTVVQTDAEFRQILDEEVEQFEESVKSHWHLSDAPEVYVKAKMGGIFGIKFTSSQFKVHKKLHQTDPKNEIENVKKWARDYKPQKRTAEHWMNQVEKK